MDDPYDTTPYRADPRPESHPERLAVVGRLLGLTPPPLDGCRVLEVGCADGGNLLAFAQAHPGCEAVGIDRSGVQIERARETAGAAGIGNARFEARDLRDHADLTGFDYVIAHGVYSWVDAPARDALLALIGAALTPHGLAYVSWNALPGWRFVGAVREMLRFATRHEQDPAARARRAREAIELLAAAAPDSRRNYRTFLEEERDTIRSRPDWFLLHDLLEPDNHAVYLHEFVAHAGDHGLQYLTDALVSASALGTGFPPEVEAGVRSFGRDPVGIEQMGDFVVNRSFRSSVLCRTGLAQTRRIGPQQLIGLHVATPAAASGGALASEEPTEFTGPEGARLRTRHPLSRAALLAAAAAWPGSLPVGGLASRARALLAAEGVTAEPTEQDLAVLGEHLLVGYVRGLVELRATPVPIRLEPGERPAAAPLARLRAARGEPVFNLRHEVVEVDPVVRALLPRVDGTRDRAALLEALLEQAGGGALSVSGPDGAPLTDPERLREALRGPLEQMLVWLARAGLLRA